MDLLDALRQGDIVALAGRPAAFRRAASERTLFGRPFPMPIGPAALARAAGVPLLPVFVFRRAAAATAAPSVPPIHVAHTANRHADLEQALQSLAAELEWAIPHRPHQWFCFRKLWG